MTTYNDWPLRFPDQATANAKLYSGGIEVVPFIDTIGIIERNVGGVVVTTPGWHVNIALEGSVPTSLLPYVIPFPAFPNRVRFTGYEGAVL